MEIFAGLGAPEIVRKLIRSSWPFERGKGLKETRPLWTPQWGHKLFGFDLGNKSSVSLRWSHYLWFDSSSPLSLVLLLAIDLSYLPNLSALIEQLLARRTTLPHSNFVYTRSNSNPRWSFVFKFIKFMFRLFTPPLGNFQFFEMAAAKATFIWNLLGF